MRDVLVERFGFDQGHIELLTDAAGSLVMPTGANIKKALDRMVNKAESGDVMFFHYSGHGTRIPSTRPGHPYRQDEAIVPCDFVDFNLITDVDFRHIVNRLPKETSFTILSDSCHSGGLIHKEREQIGPSSIANYTILQSCNPNTIPFESILQHFASLTGINTSDIGIHLLESFGADARLKFSSRPVELNLFELGKQDEGILLSGCQENETSADMNPMMTGGKVYGAFSNAVQTVLKDHLGPLSNRQVVVMSRKVLQAAGFVQHPCLYCSDDSADTPFL
ncbi:metacaspase-9 [Juglans regia]|nr:metacaspase-9 [Juglans regia]